MLLWKCISDKRKNWGKSVSALIYIFIMVNTISIVYLSTTALHISWITEVNELVQIWFVPIQWTKIGRGDCHRLIADILVSPEAGEKTPSVADNTPCVTT